MLQMFRRFAWKVLGIDQLESRVDKIESRLDATEAHCKMTLSQFGGYKHRNRRELKLMGAQIQDLLDTCEAILERSKSEEAIKRTKALIKRLKNHDTRIVNAKMKGGMDVAVKSAG